MENTKSEVIPDNRILNSPQDLVLDVTEENDEKGIWFIHTDNLYYLQVNSSCDLIQSNCDQIKFQNSEMGKLTNTAKKRFFNADNNNVHRKEEINMEQEELKFHRKCQTTEF